MPNSMKLLIVGHCKETVASLEPVLRKIPTVKFDSRLFTNGTVDPLYGVRDIPDVILLELTHNWEDKLKALNVRPPAHRPKVLAVGAAEDAAVLRRAIQGGVRDFLNVPIDPSEVETALNKLVEEKRAVHNPVPQRMTAIFNAKGGSGGSLLASNLSHIMAAELGLRVALIDLDLQLGTSALCLDLDPTLGIGDVLFGTEDVDAIALQGYMTHHDSGLDVLASTPHGFFSSVEVLTSRMDQILNLVAQSYDHVVVDVPRMIDPTTLSVLARADRIVLVMQQYLAHLHDAKRIVQGLRGHIENIDERLVVAINRYQNKASVSARDIAQGLNHLTSIEIPNDYKRVCTAEELGVPLYTHSRSAPVSKALRQLARNLSGVTPHKKGLFKRIFTDRHPSV